MNATAQTTDGTLLELPSADEILVTRTFNAPARLVFQALNTPEYVRRWWAPKSHGTIVSVDIDFRVGGAWRYVMKTHDGQEVGFSGVYQEIEAPTRTVATEAFEPFLDAAAIVTVTLSEKNGVTTMTSRSRYPSPEIRDQVIATGMESGMRESMQQLSEVVASLR